MDFFFMDLAQALKKFWCYKKRVIRIITKSHPRTPCRPLFSQNGIFTVCNLYVFELLTYLKMNENDFKLRNEFHVHNTRNNANLQITYTILTKIQTNFISRAINVYNKLPMRIRQLNVQQFKDIILSWLKSDPFYSMTECYDIDFNVLI